MIGWLALRASALSVNLIASNACSMKLQWLLLLAVPAVTLPSAVLAWSLPEGDMRFWHTVCLRVCPI